MMLYIRTGLSTNKTESDSTCRGNANLRSIVLPSAIRPNDNESWMLMLVLFPSIPVVLLIGLGRPNAVKPESNRFETVNPLRCHVRRFSLFLEAPVTSLFLDPQRKFLVRRMIYWYLPGTVFLVEGCQGI